MEQTNQIIAETIDYLVAHYSEQPDLDFLARRAGYETTHFQKLFKDWVGISPKRMIQYMNMRHARELLVEGKTTMEAAYGAGLSGTGRLYDLFVMCQAVTPGDVQYKGKGLTVTYGFHPTPLGEILVAQTERGVCFLGFVVDSDRAITTAALKTDYFPHAKFIESTESTAQAAAHIMKIWAAEGDADHRLRLDLHGTNMQIQVWQALLRIPLGETQTYQDIAKAIDRPKAARAIGNAVGANPISLLIPCHRVIRATGIIDNYNWGSARKKLILGLEQKY